MRLGELLSLSADEAKVEAGFSEPETASQSKDNGIWNPADPVTEFQNLTLRNPESKTKNVEMFFIMSPVV